MSFVLGNSVRVLKAATNSCRDGWNVQNELKILDSVGESVDYVLLLALVLLLLIDLVLSLLRDLIPNKKHCVFLEEST